MKKGSGYRIWLPGIICLFVVSCKKDGGSSGGATTGTGGFSTSSIVKTTGWERVGSIIYSEACSVSGAFDVQDLAIQNDSIGILFDATTEVFGGMAHGCLGVYKSTMKIGDGKNKTIKKLGTNLIFFQGLSPNRTDFKARMYFAENSLNGRVMLSQAASGNNSLTFTEYGETDEDAHALINQYKQVYNDQLEATNIVHTANGSVCFAKANPDKPFASSPMYMNYYDASTQRWLTDYAISTPPYYPGYNIISTALVNKPAVITGCWAFSTSTKADFRAMVAGADGKISILKPNFTNYHFDTLATYTDAGITGVTDLKMISGASFGNTFIGLAYSNINHKLYEFKWTEGATSITKLFGDIVMTDALQTPQFPGGQWKYFELKSDGTAFQLVQNTNGLVLRSVNANGVKIISQVSPSDITGISVFLGMPRYYNGYYYATAYEAPNINNVLLLDNQLDIYRIKE